jgi:hypothetical protein
MTPLRLTDQQLAAITDAARSRGGGVDPGHFLDSATSPAELTG